MGTNGGLSAWLLAYVDEGFGVDFVDSGAFVGDSFFVGDGAEADACFAHCFGEFAGDADGFVAVGGDDLEVAGVFSGSGVLQMFGGGVVCGRIAEIGFEEEAEPVGVPAGPAEDIAVCVAEFDGAGVGMVGALHEIGAAFAHISSGEEVHGHFEDIGEFAVVLLAADVEEFFVAVLGGANLAFLFEQECVEESGAGAVGFDALEALVLLAGEVEVSCVYGGDSPVHVQDG